MAKRTKPGAALPIFVLNGPNLNLLGTREPEIYGRTTLAEIEEMAATRAKAHGFDLTFRQTNHEGVLVDWLQEARISSCGVILNAAALTHTSIALHDACKMIAQPVIELHLSNPHTREEWRHRSFIGLTATGTICGFGAHGYMLAVDAVAEILRK